MEVSWNLTVDWFSWKFLVDGTTAQAFRHQN